MKKKEVLILGIILVLVISIFQLSGVSSDSNLNENSENKTSSESSVFREEVEEILTEEEKEIVKEKIRREQEIFFIEHGMEVSKEEIIIGGEMEITILEEINE